MTLKTSASQISPSLYSSPRRHPGVWGRGVAFMTSKWQRAYVNPPKEKQKPDHPTSVLCFPSALANLLPAPVLNLEGGDQDNCVLWPSSQTPLPHFPVTDPELLFPPFFTAWRVSLLFCTQALCIKKEALSFRNPFLQKAWILCTLSY